MRLSSWGPHRRGRARHRRLFRVHATQRIGGCRGRHNGCAERRRHGRSRRNHRPRRRVDRRRPTAPSSAGPTADGTAAGATGGADRRWCNRSVDGRRRRQSGRVRCRGSRRHQGHHHAQHRRRLQRHRWLPSSTRPTRPGDLAGRRQRRRRHQRAQGRSSSRSTTRRPPTAAWPPARRCSRTAASSPPSPRASRPTSPPSTASTPPASRPSTTRRPPTRSGSWPSPTSSPAHRAARYIGSYVKRSSAAPARRSASCTSTRRPTRRCRDTFVPEAKKLGLDVAASSRSSPTRPRSPRSCCKMQQAGVQILVISATAEAIGIIRDAKSMGYERPDHRLGLPVRLRHRRPAATSSTASPACAPTPPSTAPAYEQLRGAHGGPGPAAATTAATTSRASSPTAGRCSTARCSSGPAPTRRGESFVTGAETIRDFDNGIIAPISCSATDHVGAYAAFPPSAATPTTRGSARPGDGRASAMTTVIVNGLFVGLVYGLLAVGLVVVYRGSRIINFAYGETGMLGAFVFSELWVDARHRRCSPAARARRRAVRRHRRRHRGRAHPAPARPAAAHRDGRHARRRRAAPRPTPAAATASTRASSRRSSRATASTSPASRSQPAQLVILAVAVVVLAGLGALYRYTSFGLRLRATALDPIAAGLVGVDTNRTSVATWALAGGLAGLSGILIAPSVAFSVVLHDVAAAAQRRRRAGRRADEHRRRRRRRHHPRHRRGGHRLHRAGQRHRRGGAGRSS